MLAHTRIIRAVAGDPREAVLEHLAREPSVGPRELLATRWTPAGVLRAAAAPGLPLRRRLVTLGCLGRPRPVPVVRPAGFGADPSGVVFLKERGIPGRRLFAVNFDDDGGHSWHWLVAAEQDEQSSGWRARLVAGGGGSFGQHDPWRAGEPRINLAGGWGANGYYGGGAIYTAERAVARVRLTFVNGVRLEDDGEGDLALFLTDQWVEIPITVQFFDPEGRVLAGRVEVEQVRARLDQLHRRRRAQP